MNNDINQYAIQCFQDEAKAILDMIPLLDENFSKAVEMIYHCNGKLIVTGVGKSGHVGQKIAATLASLGTPAFFLNPLDAYHGDLGMLSPEDILLAISYSGNTDELLRILPPVLERKIPIIAISSNPQSLLGKNSVCHLTVKVEREADPLNLAPTSSTTATMAMGDALACALVHVRNFRETDFAVFHPGGNLGRKLLSSVKDNMISRNLPVVSIDDNVETVIAEINKTKFGLAVVVDNKKVIGVITDGDVRRNMQAHKNELLNVLISDIMTTHPKTINQNDKLSKAAIKMRENNINALIVVDENNRLVGLISSLSLL